MTPTLAECDATEAALDDWANLSYAAQEDHADMGAECAATYPVLYVAAVECFDQAGACCADFGAGSPLDSACALAKPNMANVHDSWCSAAKPGNDYVCWRMFDQGEGWSDVDGTHGRVDAHGHLTGACTWDVTDWPSCWTPPAVYTHGWARPGEDECSHSVAATTVVTVDSGFTIPIPAGQAADTKEVEC